MKKKKNKDAPCKLCKVTSRVVCWGCSANNNWIHYDPIDPTVGECYADDINADREEP